MFRVVTLVGVSLLLLSAAPVAGEETTPFTEVTFGSTFTFASTHAYTDPPRKKENGKGDGGDEEEGPTEVTEYTFTYPMTTDANNGQAGDGDGSGDASAEEEEKKKEKKEKKEGKGTGEKKEKKEKDPEKVAAQKAKRKEKKAQQELEAGGGTGGRRKGTGKKKGKGKGGEEPTESDSASGGGGRGRGRGRGKKKKKKVKVNKDRNGETDGTGQGEEGSVTEAGVSTSGTLGTTSAISTSRAPIILSTEAPSSLIGEMTQPCSAGDYMTESGCQQCGENSYSGAGASSCTSCPDGKISAAGSTSETDCEYAPCATGDYMTESGCQQCGENTYSGAGASSCTSCPDGKISAAGSASEDDCEYAPCSAGDYMTESGCQQCGENTYSGAGASSCTSCPEGGFSAAGSTSESDCGPEKRPTCNCWTAECGYCTNKACTVKQDHPNSGIEVELHSPLSKETVNTVVLYNEAGETLGNLQLSLRGIFLTGCVRCRVPPVLRRARNKEGITSWTLTLRGSVLQISIGGKVLVEKRLGAKCASQYEDVSSFAFHKMSCESSFSLVEGEMQAGAMVTAGCNNSCTSD